MKKFNLTVPILGTMAALSLPTYAHGEEVIMDFIAILVGAFISFLVVLSITWCAVRRIVPRLVIGCSWIIGILIVFFSPENLLPKWVQNHETGIFFYSLLLPSLIAGTTTLLLWSRKKS